MTQPTMFIGSSGESHSLAVVLQSLLDRDPSVRVRSQGAFEQTAPISTIFWPRRTDMPEIIAALGRSLYPGDFLIFQVNCGTNELSSSSSFLTNPVVLEYTCLPLRIAGLDPSPEKVSVHTVSSKSIFKCAHSVESVYATVEIDGQVIANTPLEYNHRYDFDGLGAEIAAHLDVEVLDREKVGNACAFLARKT